MTRIIWCTPSRSDEVDLISAVSAAGHTVVRRCLEATDLLAASAIEPEARIVVDIHVPRLGADVISSVERLGSGRTVALVDDDTGVARAQSLGVANVIDMRPGDAVERLIDMLEVTPSTPPTSSATVVGRPDKDAPADHGRIVAVTGAPGSPGCTSVALGLAQSWASDGERVCVIDCDTLAPSLAATVGMTEDVSGLLLAARYAEQGALDARSLGSCCRRLTDDLWVLTGVGSPERWASARPSILDRVWSACREHFDRVVIDAGMLLDVEELDDPFGAGHQRDAATVSALRASDLVVVVTRPDPIATLRLVQHLPGIRKITGDADLRVLVNRTERGDASAVRQIADALLEAGMPAPVHSLREDPSVRSCVTKGALLKEIPSTARYRKAVRRLVREMVD